MPRPSHIASLCFVVLIGALRPGPALAADWLDEMPAVPVVVQAVREQLEVNRLNPGAYPVGGDADGLASTIMGTLVLLRWFMEFESRGEWFSEWFMSPARRAERHARMEAIALEYMQVELALGLGVRKHRGSIKTGCDRPDTPQHRKLYVGEECYRRALWVAGGVYSSYEYRQSIFPRLFCKSGQANHERFHKNFTGSGSNFVLESPGVTLQLPGGQKPLGGAVCKPYGGDANGNGLCDAWEKPLRISSGSAACVECDLSKADQDGDGLPDAWETKAIPVSGGRCVPIDLVFPNGDMPDPKVKDIYVELDYMTKTRAEWVVSLKLVEQAFANSPQGAIKLHVQIDEKLPDYHCVDFRLTPSVWQRIWRVRLWNDARDPECSTSIQFDNLEVASFGTKQQRERTDWPNGLTTRDVLAARRMVFRHALAVRAIVDDPKSPSDSVAFSNPAGRAVPGGANFAFGVHGEPPLVTIATAHALLCYGNPRDPNLELKVDSLRFNAVTFMHELGHTLGLTHAGSDPKGIDFKPNYMSVMNYWYGNVAALNQTKETALQCNNKDEKLRQVVVPIDYSPEALPELDECDLVESNGLRGDLPGVTPKAAWAVYAHAGARAVIIADASGPIDWNGNGRASDQIGSPGQNIRHPEPIAPLCGTKLTGHNDWLSIARDLRCRRNMPPLHDKIEAC
jgi:hypothetical protein